MIDNVVQKGIEENKGIHELFEMQAKLNPNRDAVHFNGKSLSYREVNLKSNQLARYLISEGIGKGMLVGICMERCDLLLIAMISILKTGAAYVPLDPAYPRQRNQYILNSAQIKYMVTQKRLKEIYNEQGLNVLAIDGQEERIKCYESSDLDIHVEKDQLSYVIFTSGSTGNPKGVQICHRNVVNLLTFMKNELDVVPDDRLLALTTVTFDISVSDLFLPLIAGACVVIAPNQTTSDAKKLAQLFEEENITIMQATPSTWYMLLETEWKGSPSLRILCAGEAWPVKLAEALLDRCKSLWNAYGPTETTIYSTMKQIQRGEKAVTLGQPVSKTTLYTVDEEGNEIKDGETGELYIGGEGVGKGYLHEPGLTAEKFIKNPFAPNSDEYIYKTGDIVKKSDNGEWEYVGRADFQVKIRGFRIELGEIEKVLLQHPEVNQAVVVVKIKNDEKYLCAYITTKSREFLEESELKDLLGSTLPHYMIPSHIQTIGNFPMTANGKIDRRALAQEQTDHKILREERVAPTTDTEKKLHELWAELLEFDDFGIHDNFLELGGHSLMANRLVTRINNLFGSQVTLMEILTGELTVHNMAEIIENNLLASISEEEMDALMKDLEGLSPEEIEKYLENYVE